MNGQKLKSRRETSRAVFATLIAMEEDRAIAAGSELSKSVIEATTRRSFRIAKTYEHMADSYLSNKKEPPK